MAALALRVDSARYIPLPADRAGIEALIESLIDTLDQLDPDPDLEANGDELDGTNAEDDWWHHANWNGEPGCPVSDPGEEVGDQEHEETLPAFYGTDQTAPPWRLSHV